MNDYRKTKAELIEAVPNFTAEKRGGALYVKRMR